MLNSKRVLNICKSHGVITPVFEEVSGGFKVILFKGKREIEPDVTKDVTKDDRILKIIQRLKGNPTIVVDELAKDLLVSRRTILRDLEWLQENRKITRIGGRKNGYWEIVAE